MSTYSEPTQLQALDLHVGDRVRCVTYTSVGRRRSFIEIESLIVGAAQVFLTLEDRELTLGRYEVVECRLIARSDDGSQQ